MRVDTPTLAFVVSMGVLPAACSVSEQRDDRKPTSVEDVLGVEKIRRVFQEEPLPSSVTFSVTPLQGGGAGVGDENRNMVFVSVPPFAVKSPIEMTVNLLKSAPPSPFKNTGPLFFTIDTRTNELDRPATILLTRAGENGLSDKSRVFTIRDARTARIPLWQARDVSTGLRVQTYEAGVFALATPTEKEFVEQFVRPPAPRGRVSFKDLNGEVGRRVSLAESAQLLGLDEQAGELLGQAEAMVETNVNTFLASPVPSDPCGNYEQQLTDYGWLVGQLSPVGDLADRVSARMESVYSRCRPTSGRLEYRVTMTPPLAEGRWEDDLQLPGSKRPNERDNRCGTTGGSGWLGIRVEGRGCYGWVAKVASSPSRSPAQHLTIDIEEAPGSGFLRLFLRDVIEFEFVWGPEDGIGVDMPDRVEVPFVHGGQRVDHIVSKDGLHVVTAWTLFLDPVDPAP